MYIFVWRFYCLEASAVDLLTSNVYDEKYMYVDYPIHIFIFQANIAQLFRGPNLSLEIHLLTAYVLNVGRKFEEAFILYMMKKVIVMAVNTKMMPGALMSKTVILKDGRIRI